MQPSVVQIVMRYGDRKYKQTLRTKTKVEADAQLVKAKFNLHLCEMGRMEIPNKIQPVSTSLPTPPTVIGVQLFAADRRRPNTLTCRAAFEPTTSATGALLGTFAAFMRYK